jgi:hypothetical protein
MSTGRHLPSVESRYIVGKSDAVGFANFGPLGFAQLVWVRGFDFEK